MHTQALQHELQERYSRGNANLFLPLTDLAPELNGISHPASHVALTLTIPHQR
jgi:hypothetical protein